MHCSRGWAQRGKSAVEETTSARGVSHTVIGAVSAFGVVNALEDAVTAIPKGTTAGNFVQFISEIHSFPSMKGFHVVMGNALIHSRDAIDPIILERVYIPVYLPELILR
ncbi:hypothetical protein [Parasitella parasitica]|uniref:Tc1-like transposase DDE domain-containing protein n=1 Tax=Parasitella parasitica TaxID=35722 RepID=A0A0B7N0R0_9FUNG|nr:hypothetical protein [Parasitella parasitica]